MLYNMCTITDVTITVNIGLKRGIPLSKAAFAICLDTRKLDSRMIGNVVTSLWPNHLLTLFIGSRPSTVFV